MVLEIAGIRAGDQETIAIRRVVLRDWVDELLSCRKDESGDKYHSQHAWNLCPHPGHHSFKGVHARVDSVEMLRLVVGVNFAAS